MTVFKRGGCYYDSTRQTDTVSPSDDLGLLARATLALPEGARAYLELVWSRTRMRYSIAPTPVNVFGLADNAGFTIPSSSPFYPKNLGLAGDLVDPLYRTVPLGQRVVEADTTAQRVLIGWQAQMAGWAMDAAVMQSVTRSTLDYASGYADSAKLIAALQTGLITTRSATRGRRAMRCSPRLR